MSEKFPSTPTYTASEISNLIGDIIKVGKSGTTFHDPKGRLLSREEIHQTIVNADLIRGNEPSGNNGEAVSGEGGHELSQADESLPEYAVNTWPLDYNPSAKTVGDIVEVGSDEGAIPEYAVKTWPTDYDPKTSAEKDDLVKVISKLQATAAGENTDEGIIPPRKTGRGIVPYTAAWPEVPSQQPYTSDFIPLNFDSQKSELLQQSRSKVRRGLGILGARLTSVVSLGKSKPTSGNNSGGGEKGGVAAKSSKEKHWHRPSLKGKLGVTALAATLLLTGGNSHDKTSGSNIPVATPPIESIASAPPEEEPTPALFSVVEETPTVYPTPTQDIKVTFWNPQLPTKSNETKSSDETNFQLATREVEDAGDSGETETATVSEEGRDGDFDQFVFEREDEDVLTDLTGDPVATSEVVADSDNNEEYESTLEMSAPVFTIEAKDGFTDLLIKYRPDLDPVEAYELFKYLVSECNGAEHIFTDVTIYPMKNGDPGIEYTGTTQFAPGVEELVNNWNPGR